MHRSFVAAAAGLSLSLALCSACTLEHVTLPDPPPAAASLASRDAYYEEHKPLGIAGEPLTAGGVAAQSPFPALVLGDGKRVSDPTDLLPAVAPRSATARAAKAAADDAVFGSGLSVCGVAGVAVGLGAIVGAEVAGLGGGGDATTVAVFGLGGLGGVVLGAAGLVWAEQLEEQAEGEKMSAFYLYERDLRRRLALRRPEEAEPLTRKWFVPAASLPPPAPASPSSSPSPSSPDPAGP